MDVSPHNLRAEQVIFNKLFAEGLFSYQHKEYKQALQKFEEAYLLYPQDGPTHLFIKKCKNQLPIKLSKG